MVLKQKSKQQKNCKLKQHKRNDTVVEKPTKQASSINVSPKKVTKDHIAKMKKSMSPQKIPVSKISSSMVSETEKRQYDLEKINVEEKNTLYTWHQSLIDRPGVTGSMVNCLEMIVKFSTDILNEQDVEVPPCMTWMDGIHGKDSLDEKERDCYGLKILFILMCSPRAKDKELKYLDNFINGPEFSLDNIASMSVLEIAERIQKIGMQNKNAYYIQQAFQKIKHAYNGRIPSNAETLRDNFVGIGMKIASLVVQYVYGTMEVSFKLCLYKFISINSNCF